MNTAGRGGRIEPYDSESEYLEDNDVEMEGEEEEKCLWLEHKKATSSVWKHFLRSATKVGKTNRFYAKCRYCNKKMDGKPDRMKRHILTYCKEVSFEARASVTEDDTKEKKLKQTSQSDVNHPNMVFLRAMVCSGVAFSFSEDFYFRKFVHLLKPSFHLASRTSLTDKYLNSLYSEAVTERDYSLQSLDCATLLWDGWSDVSHNSIYALMLLHDHDKSQILDIISLSKMRHTAFNMVDVTVRTLGDSAVKTESVRGCVTDSPTVMIKYRKELRHKFRGMVPMPCALHVANTFTKDVCAIDKCREVARANCKIVNFFTKSHVWFALAKDWAGMRPEGRCTFQALCENRWYFMCKVCLSIKHYKDFLEWAARNQGMTEEYPSIPNDVLTHFSSHHFVKNSDLVDIIKPIADVIGELEKSTTNLADIVLQFLKLQIAYDCIAARTIMRNPFVNDAILKLSRRYKQYFNEDIYVIALFLYPRHRDLAISRFHQFDTVKRSILCLVKEWGFSKSEAVSISQDLTKYKSFQFLQPHLDAEPKDFWAHTQQFQDPTRLFARYVFLLKGHAAPVETLFSNLSYAKPKIRNRMTAKNFKTMAIVRKHLKDSIPLEHRAKRMKRETTTGAEIPQDQLTSAPAEEDPIQNASLLSGMTGEETETVDDVDFEEELDRMVYEVTAHEGDEVTLRSRATLEDMEGPPPRDRDCDENIQQPFIHQMFDLDVLKATLGSTDTATVTFARGQTADDEGGTDSDYNIDEILDC